MNEAIAVVGMACRYPDAAKPRELWENVLAGRRAFRRIPAERLNLADYLDPDGRDGDRMYITKAAVLRDYAFDRVGFRVTGSSFRSADMTHWLALEVASEALSDAGFADGRGLPVESTGVLLGNTLTGEFSRANTLRLRWPYVRRVVARTLQDEGLAEERLGALLARLEQAYKGPFPPLDEESLAGGLSNTIAGRICNHFDLRGGGYTLDGACSSSLLALSNACSALIAGDLDVALAGGVDLSLDPFELVGFARTGALSRTEMRVYDRRSDGFWPGEGCGMLVLMRHRDALAMGLRCYALIRGWGISSDGGGGITRPEAEGQRMAMDRAYRRAGYPIAEVALFEGHGTGTSVGDGVELKALNEARRGAMALAAVGSIKANIGHTKAAAGAAGFIKTVLALNAQVLPPATAVSQPHAELTRGDTTLRVLEAGEPWPTDRPLRAGVSSFGFGGIDVHLTLEGAAAARRTALTDYDRRLLCSRQDTEVFFLQGQDRAALAERARRLAETAVGMAYAELADLAAHLAAPPAGEGGVRAAVLAASPERLAARLATLAEWLEEGVERRLDPAEGILLATPTGAPRIGLLFSGQASPVRLGGGAMARRFPAVERIYREADLPAHDDGSTAVAQPAIVAAERAVLALLAGLGIEGDLGLGHSLGEYSALHWAGAMDGERLQALAHLRGRLMAGVSGPAGAMLAVQADGATVAGLLDADLVVSCFNSPRQTVVSGEAQAVERFGRGLQAGGLRVTRLPVKSAFHSPLMAPAVAELGEALRGVSLAPLKRRVISTVTADELAPDSDLAALLTRQMTHTVHFTAALERLLAQVDLCLEVGPGQVLSGLVEEAGSDLPVFPLDGAGKGLAPFLLGVAAAYVLGAPVRREVLFRDRLTRPFDPDRRPSFLANPCEQAPALDVGVQPQPQPMSAPLQPPIEAAQSGESPASGDVLETLRAVVAAKAELPPEAVADDSRLLVDLHLNSISVGQIVAEAARRLGLPPPAAPTDYADARLCDIAESLRELEATGAGAAPPPERFPAGVDQWVHPFRVDWVERALPSAGRQSAAAGAWRLLAPGGAAVPEGLAETVAGLPGGGLLVWLPGAAPEDHIALLLQAGKATVEARLPRFVLVQEGAAAAPLARTLRLEHPDLSVGVLDLPPDGRCAGRVAAEVAAAADWLDVRYDADGRRFEPELVPLPQDRPSDTLPLGPEDVLLVSGGGKGIAAESALALARATGARLALLGRSDPAADAGLAANLERLAGLGVRYHYASADVTDAGAVAIAVAACEAALGPVTALLHGAGVNRPHLLHELTEDDFAGTLGPKTLGLDHLLSAVDPQRLKTLITFGSIIARSGMRGEADYALANEALARRTEAFAAAHPNCRCLCLEWSIWSGVGMGERLGRIDALLREGITPVAPEAGVELLLRLLAEPDLPVRLVASGRLGALPTLRLARRELPFRRFLDPVAVHYPGVELVVQPELSVATDPYLAEHALHGEPLFPAVMGLEAMAQAAMALLGEERPPWFEDVELLRPIAVPADGRHEVRLAALARDGHRVDLVLRSATDGFQQDCFRARCRFDTPDVAPVPLELPSRAPRGLDMAADIYVPLLFHAGRFRRVEGYDSLDAWHCVARVGEGEGAPWFAAFLPPDLALGEPGSRDAGLHAIQACIPQARLLPVGASRVVFDDPNAPGPWTVRARETDRSGDTFTYDMQLLGRDGTLREAWVGLRLRRVESIPHEHWHPALLVPYLERRVAELLPGVRVRLALEREPTAEPGLIAMRHALGGDGAILRRGDGRPESPDGQGVAASHAGALTLAAAGGVRLTCDLEPVTPRAESLWADLLGSEHQLLARVLANALGESFDRSATRVWGALECLKKDGAGVATPLTLSAAEPDGWALLAGGGRRIASGVVRVAGEDAELAVALLEGPVGARL